MVCIQNDDQVDLEVRKIYRVIPDAAARKFGLLRIMDDSSKDYLYPAAYFLPMVGPKRLLKIRQATPGA